MRKSSIKKLASVAAGYLLLSTVLSLAGGASAPRAGVDPDLDLTRSDSLRVVEDGAVVDAMDVHGTIYVYGNDVTIRNSHVDAPGWYGIRVMDDATGLRIEDTTVDCTGERGWGIVFDHFTAERVAVNGCEMPFAHLDRDHVSIVASAIDGQAFDHAGVADAEAPRVPKTDVGVSSDLELTPSESMHVHDDGAVVDAMDVHGTIYVYGNDVTIRNSHVDAPGWYGIRVMDDATGLRIEDTTVDCTGERGWGIVFDHFTAERVAVNGCEVPFAHLDRDQVHVLDSSVDGFAFDSGSSDPGTNPDQKPTVPPVTEKPPGPTDPGPGSTTTTTTQPAPTTTVPSPGDDDPVPGVGEFVRRVDVGPQSSTYGHSPVGALRLWTGGSTITDSSKARDADGVMRFRGYRFTGPIKIATKDLAFIDSEFVMPPLSSNVPGVIWSSSTMPEGTMLIDHCRVDAGMTGYTLAAVNVYQPLRATIRYSLVEGAADGIRAQSNSLYENNYISVSGMGTKSRPGHIDGIHGEYFKFNWTARHNTIIGGVQPTPEAIAAGATVRPERGTNSAIWAPRTANGPAGPSGSEGVVAEDNYIDGFNYGIGVDGTNPSNPHIVRNNTFGKNFRWYPNIRIRTFDGYAIVENNHFDRIFDETTGNTHPG